MIRACRTILPALALMCGAIAFAPAAGNAVENRPAQQNGAEAGVPIGKGFDFYVLALSWSPSYCKAEGRDANRQQCAVSRPYAFIVHGLWPQFERGYPKNCGTNERKVSRRTLRAMSDLMPSAGLVRHEWRTHGACAGLDQDDYFRVLRAAREKVTIPAAFRRADDVRRLSARDVESAFMKVNPGMAANGVAVTCDRRYLREIRICMTRDLQFRACGAIDRKGCRAAAMVVPPVGGG